MAKKKAGNKLAAAYLGIQGGDSIPDIGRALLRSVGINNPLPATIQEALDAYYKFEADMELIRERAEEKGES
jgi:hypothetical protein